MQRFILATTALAFGALSSGFTASIAGEVGTLSNKIVLRMDGISGDIDITAFSGSAVNRSADRGAGPGRAECRDVSLVKQVDQSSLLLLTKMFSGRHTTKAVITFGSPRTYEVELRDVLVTSISQGDSTVGNRGFRGVTERVALSAAKYKYTFFTGATSSTFGFDCKQNRQL